MQHRMAEVLRSVKKVARKRAKAKLENGVCLIDGCCDEALIRGVCGYHYRQFLNAKSKQLTKRSKEDFDREQVEAGRIASSRQGRKPRSVNPFTSTA